MQHRSEACGQKLLPRVSEVWVSGPHNPTAGLVTATGKARTSFEPPPTLTENQERRDVRMLSHSQLFASPWTVARQDSLFITISWSFLTLMSIESLLPTNHLILCHPLFLLPSDFPSIKVFSNESALRTK